MSRVDTVLRRTLTEDVRHDTLLDLRPEGVRSRLLPARLPPAAAGQLANLAQVLDLHPAGIRSVAFVASGRSEGTTTCVANVGSYLAHQQARVLMVDANLAWPALHTLAGAESGPGLLDVIAGEADLKTAVQSTTVPNLFILSSGEREPSGTGRLLPPAALRERLLKETIEYDFVLIDCPPVNAYEDAAVTAATCDGVLLVVEGGRTQREQAHASKALLARAHCRVLGVLMNKRKFYVPQFVYDRL